MFSESMFLNICDVPQKKGISKDVNVNYQVQNAPDIDVTASLLLANLTTFRASIYRTDYVIRAKCLGLSSAE